ncbi:putative increased DNA methylation [Helianthus anomalus]
MALSAGIAQEIGHELEPEVEYFVPLPKPYVRMFGAAANGGGRPLANVLELTASKSYYNVVVELPQVQYEDEARWIVNINSEVTIEGQISHGALYADKPIIGNKRKRVQLCPTEPWAISFYFPGLVDWWTASVHVPSSNIIEILVMKTILPPEPTATGSTASITGAGHDLGTVGDTSLTPSDMVD